MTKMNYKMTHDLPDWHKFHCKIWGTPVYNFPLITPAETYTWTQNVLNSIYTLGLSMILNELQCSPLIIKDLSHLNLLRKYEVAKWTVLEDYPLRLNILYSLHKVSIRRKTIFLRILKLIYNEWDTILSKDLLINKIKLCFV